MKHFAAEIYGWLVARGAGEMEAADMVELALQRSIEFAKIFSGEHPHYIPVKGWNARSVGLGVYLKADLGHFWQSNRAEYGDDPFRVFYGWFLWAVSDAAMKPDEFIAAATGAARISQAVRLLTGSMKRIGIDKLSDTGRGLCASRVDCLRAQSW